MGDHDSDAAMQSDMHFKPLDNNALIKPLRKAPNRPDAAVSHTHKRAAPAEEQSAPIVVMPKPLPAINPDDELFSVPPESPALGDSDLFNTSGTPAAEESPAEEAPAKSEPIPPELLNKRGAKRSAKVRAAKEKHETDRNGDDLFGESAAPKTQPVHDKPVPPVTENRETGEPLAAEAAPLPVKEKYITPDAADDEDDDALFTESYAPSAEEKPATPPIETKSEAPTAPPSGADSADQPAEASAPPKAPVYQPPNSQVHMMELMKTVFANALNASLSAKQSTAQPTKPDVGQPPSPVPPEEPASMSDLRKLLITLQQKIRQAKIPVVIVLEGLSAAGKGMMLSRLIEGLDSRGYKAYPIRKPNCVEKAYPAMWRYWTRMPADGNIALFCSSWYGELNKGGFARRGADESLNNRLNEIISMESQLVCDGVLILKFFLNISRQEQYNRLKKMESKKSTAWHVDDHDREQNKLYDEYLKGMQTLMSMTHITGAPWHVLDATNLKDCARNMYRTVIQTFEAALAERAQGLRPWDVPMLPNLSPIPSLGFPPLASIDPNQQLDAPYKSELKALKKRLYKLQAKLYRRGIPLVAAFEGWDAAGKGGAIRRLTSGLDARGFSVTPISEPTPIELSHHHMWRFWTALPPKGHITIFDRTWYGRVMVERIESLCTVPQWQRAYEEINRFEKLLTDNGAILCKFWLQIDSDTQLERFNARQADPEKQWKITDEDWRNREKWPAYEQALNEVLQRTHTAYAPWTVVEANNKDFARIKVLRTVVDAIEKRLDRDKNDD
jgi:AMP-polyphosphate phosphotransferase